MPHTPLSVGMHFLHRVTPFAWKVPPPAEPVVCECPLMNRYHSFHFDLTQPGPSLLCMRVLHWNGHSFVLLSMIFFFFNFWRSILISFLFPFLSSMSAAPRFVSSIHLVAVVTLLRNTALRSWHTHTQPPTFLPSTSAPPPLCIVIKNWRMSRCLLSN